MCGILVSEKIDIGHFYQGGLSRTTINHGGYLDFKTHALSTKITNACNKYRVR